MVVNIELGDYFLFIDDERLPPRDNSLWIVARTVEDGRRIIREFGYPIFVSFDHDLGTEETGLDFARHLIDLDLDYGLMPEGFQWYVHSQNPVGRDNINGLLNSYMKTRC